MIRRTMLGALLLLLCFPEMVLGLGRVKHECPDGFFISNWTTVYDAGTRLYSFGCAPLLPFLVEKEECRESEPASSLNGDMFLACRDLEYAAGVSILEDMKQQRWSLLCCSSPKVSIIHEKCQVSAFVNDFFQSNTFSSDGRLIRKWQSLYNETIKDRKWWVQICPFSVASDTVGKKGPVDKSRFTRNVPDRFGPSRFEQIPRIRVNPIVGGKFPIQRKSTSRSTKGYLRKVMKAELTTTTTTIKPVDNNLIDYYDNLYEDLFDSPDTKKSDPFKKSPGPAPETPSDQQVPGKVKRLFSNIQDGIDIASFFIADEIEGFNDPLPPKFAKSSDKTSKTLSSERPKGALQNVMEYLGLCPGLG